MRLPSCRELGQGGDDGFLVVTGTQHLGGMAEQSAHGGCRGGDAGRCDVLIYLLDTNVVAEITTRPRPAPAVVAWARSVPAPALYLSVITIAEIEAGIQGTPDLVRRTAFERALADIRDQYRDRIATVGEREALAYLALRRRLRPKYGGSSTYVANS
ncbi:PIN domain-containing protein [Streptomyces sp. NPDC001502]|uniref:PIN domain-containing protein n=1 Tax=Streptomyces sp. NPDC001502 TaxID=3364578 RepID=UPI0036BA7528